MGKKALVYNLASLTCGIWFLLTGWAWTYLMNVVIAFPIGILGLILWYKGRQIDKEDKWNKSAIAVFGLGTTVSIVALFLYK